MKIADTISVNPGKKTLGHVEESTSSIFRSQVLGTKSNINSVDLVKVFFPSCSAGLNEYAKYAVPLRTVFATILLVTGIILLTNPLSNQVGFAVCTLCFGGFLALGLFTRPLMAAAAAFYFISGALALRNGFADMNVFSLMFGCLIFCVIGAGKYSCDAVIRNIIKRHRRISEIKRKEDLMGYKAFHSVKY